MERSEDSEMRITEALALLTIPVMAAKSAAGRSLQSAAAPRTEGSLWETVLGACGLRPKAQHRAQDRRSGEHGGQNRGFSCKLAVNFAKNSLPASVQRGSPLQGAQCMVVASTYSRASHRFPHGRNSGGAPPHWVRSPIIGDSKNTNTWSDWITCGHSRAAITAASWDWVNLLRDIGYSIVGLS